jgi:hypothetical protein
MPGLQPWTPPLFGTSLRFSAPNLNDARESQFSDHADLSETLTSSAWTR